MDNNIGSDGNRISTPLADPLQPSSQQTATTQSVATAPFAGNLTDPNVNKVAGKGFISRFKLKVVIPVLIFVFLAISTSWAYFFVFVPKAQAQEFIDTVSKDYYGVKGAIKKISQNYGDVSNSFEISKGAFFEITTLRTFQESKIDTAQDILDIADTLTKVSAARENKAKLEVPSDVSDLNSKLDAYYVELDTAMNFLLKYEQFQMEMIIAVGDEYNDKTEKLFDVYKTDTPRPVVLAYFNDLAALGDVAIGRLEKLGQPVPDQVEFYNYILVSEKDRIDTIKKMMPELAIGEAEHDEAANNILLEFAFRQEGRNADNKKSAQKVVEDSILRRSFDSVLSAESSLVTILDGLKEKYGIKNEESLPNSEKETSSSAKESTSGAN